MIVAVLSSLIQILLPYQIWWTRTFCFNINNLRKLPNKINDGCHNKTPGCRIETTLIQSFRSSSIPFYTFSFYSYDGGRRLDILLSAHFFFRLNITYGDKLLFMSRNSKTKHPQFPVPVFHTFTYLSPMVWMTIVA